MTRQYVLTASIGVALCAIPVSLHRSHESVSLSLDKADARIGRPLTPLSVAGVNRRAVRRSYYGYTPYTYGYAPSYAYPSYGYAASATYPVYGYAAPSYSGSFNRDVQGSW